MANRKSRKGESTSKDSMPALFNRYIWLVELIESRGHITFNQIDECWQNSQLNDSEQPFALKTFHNHREAIRQMFDINIACNRRGGFYYYIENPADMRQEGAREWLLSSFSVNKLINESHKLKESILFEPIPSGRKFLTPMLTAIRDGIAVKIEYHTYKSDEVKSTLLRPYCIKVFRQRWYVLGHSEASGALRTYSLERIHSVTPTDSHYTIPDDFSGEIYFEDCFGIEKNDRVECVELKLFSERKTDDFFRNLPLHSSQEEVERTAEYTLFRYHLGLTYDLRQEIHSYGDEVEVVAPQSLREHIAEDAKAMLKRYR